MLQLTLNIKDHSKIEFLSEILKRMEFVEIIKSDETESVEIDSLVSDIYQNRVESAKELQQKLDNLFDNL